MSKSTFKILFYLRKNQVNKDGTVCIMIRLSLNGEITQFSSKLSVKPDAWDTVLGKAKGNTQKARQLNETLEDIRASLKNHYRDIEVHESFVTVEKIRNAFLGITAKQRTLLELSRNTMRMQENWSASARRLPPSRSMTAATEGWRNL